ncbi:sporulation related protein [Thermovibrio guaymasensis]|uniref:Sporulation related protein n=1 Tax=Thermovibrio guaymasensis TaxID=240167 RepID=A0A420W818_9BACT|nr:SPOR domain-containing protein [Thermovibrio guaymasensis]RKQ63428.1 sporulation related protein [Thermovibrio guaymasensis]
MRFCLSLITAFLFILLSYSFAQIPKPGSRVYTVQVASLKSKVEAESILKKVSSFPGARISYRNGRYKVRVGFFKTYKEAQEFVKESGLTKVVSDYYITRISFNPEGVFFPEKEEKSKEIKTEVKTPQEVKEEEKEVETESPVPLEKEKEVSTGEDSGTEKEKEEVEPDEEKQLESAEVKESREDKDLTSDVKKQVFSYKEPLPKETKVKKEKEEGGNWKKVALPTFIITFLFVFFSLLRRRKGKLKETDFESYVADLLNQGKYKELIELAVPYLMKRPKDTFVKKALAESYEKLGRYLEAADVYSEIAKDLEEKGLNVLAEDFKRRANELYQMEFGKR